MEHLNKVHAAASHPPVQVPGIGFISLFCFCLWLDKLRYQLCQMFTMQGRMREQGMEIYLISPSEVANQMSQPNDLHTF